MLKVRRHPEALLCAVRISQRLLEYLAKLFSNHSMEIPPLTALGFIPEWVRNDNIKALAQ